MQEEQAQKLRNWALLWINERKSYGREKYPEYDARIPFYFPEGSLVSIKTSNYLYIYITKERYGLLTFSGYFVAELDDNDLPSINNIDDSKEPKPDEIWQLLYMPKPVVQYAFCYKDENDLDIADTIKQKAREWVDEQVALIRQQDNLLDFIRKIDSERGTQLYDELYEAITCYKMGLNIAAISTFGTALETACIIALEKRCNITPKDLKKKKGGKEPSLNDYLKELEENNLLSEKTLVMAKAIKIIRNSTAHSKSGKEKEYATSFVIEAMKDIIVELFDFSQ